MRIPISILTLQMAALVAALAAAGCARHYTTNGPVLRIDRPGAQVTISHDAFPGFMDAMAMPFDLKGRASRAPLTPGDRVQFRLSVKGTRSWIDRLCEHERSDSMNQNEWICETPCRKNFRASSDFVVTGKCLVVPIPGRSFAGSIGGAPGGTAHRST